MAEGSETPGGDAGAGPQGRRPPGRSEGDLLSERRARRAAETGEAALMLRAEAAEATVQTLERHVSSLQARLREAEEERRGLSELLEAEKVLALEREHELRRVKQREYAEQQLRVEAEERLVGVERDSQAEIERLSARVQAGEDDVRELAHSLEDLQRQLGQAERLATAERASGLAEVRAVVERELHARLADLERRVGETQIGLERERSARERSERLLESMRAGHLQMGELIGEMKGIVERLLGAAALAAPPSGAIAPGVVAHADPQSGTQATGPVLVHAPADVIAQARGAEMTDALAAAVERLRTRAQTVAPAPEPPPVAPPALPRYKHSMSWLARRRIKRKQRRAR
ncbi:MAG TPA: hypothetical protein VK252_02235 [Solirubrobacteraceae bacterium]|nr:hypothetical protein [Solirubrobacteraceae bacterium]